MGKKPLASVTYKNERISIKNSLPYIKSCVTSLLCGPWVDLWPFYGKYCKRFSLYRAFSLTWPASMQIYQIYGNKESVYIRKEFNSHRIGFGTPTWPPVYSFGTPIWPPWRHVTVTCAQTSLFRSLMVSYTCKLCNMALFEPRPGADSIIKL